MLQTITTGPGHPDYVPGEYEGNCLQTAVACIFNLELEQVPHFAMYPKDYDPANDKFRLTHGTLWTRALRRFIRPYDLELWFYGHDHDDDDEEQINETDLVGTTLMDMHGEPLHPYGLGGIQSPRGDFKHTVVITTNPVKVIWDPSPHQNGYDRPVTSAEAFGLHLRYYDYPDYDPCVQQIFDRDLGENIRTLK